MMDVDILDLHAVKEKTEKNKRSVPDTMKIPNRLEKSVKRADGLATL